eukprot:gene5108-507_t
MQEAQAPATLGVSPTGPGDRETRTWAEPGAVMFHGTSLEHMDVDIVVVDVESLCSGTLEELVGALKAMA